MSVQWRLKISVQGLKLFAVVHATPYLEADGSAMEAWRVYIGRLKDLSQKTEATTPKG